MSRAQERDVVAKIGGGTAPGMESRIVVAARDTLLDGASRFAVAEVARRASVTRRTVYQRFRSKAGLLDAVIIDFERRSRIVEREVVSGPVTNDPASWIGSFLERTTAIWASDEHVVRSIFELGTDPQVRAIIDAHDAGRRAAIRREASKLESMGKLREGVSARRASEVLWFLTSFETYDFMRRRNRLSVRATAAALSMLARSILVGGPTTELIL